MKEFPSNNNFVNQSHCQNFSAKQSNKYFWLFESSFSLSKLYLSQVIEINVASEFSYELGVGHARYEVISHNSFTSQHSMTSARIQMMIFHE